MARILEFCDGAERQDVSWWTTTFNSAMTATTSNAIHGSYCYFLTGPDGHNGGLKILSSALSEFYFRCYIRADPAGQTNIRFRNSGTTLLLLAHNTSSSRWDITLGATGDTGSNSIIPATWQCLEVYYKISDTVGVVTVRIDGVQVFTFSGDTKPGSDTTVDNIFIVNGKCYLDDFALDDAQWCGLSYYLPMTPNANGDVNQWTPTGSVNNYANVSIPSSDATYNTGTTGQADEYNMTTASVSDKTVLRVIPFARLQNAAGGTVNLGVRTNSNNYAQSTPTPVSFTWEVGAEYITNPNTGNPWSQSEIDALQLYVAVP